MTIQSNVDFEFLETPDGMVVVTDPDMGQVAETEYDVVDGSGTTGGPNRYTVHVPFDLTTVSMGKGSPLWIKDDGFTSITEKHSHIHVRNPQTMLLLGQRTQHGWAGPNGADNPGSNQGFMVVTEGRAWQEARGHQYLFSKESDAVLRTAGPNKRAVVQADQGELDLLAKKKVYAVAPTISIMAPAAFSPATSFNYATDWTPALPETEAGKIGKATATWFGIGFGAHDLGVKFPKIVKSWKKGRKELETSLTDSAKWALDLVKWGMTVNKMTKLFSTSPSPGQLKLGAEADVGVLAGGDIGMWGGSGFSAGGGIWTSISAGVSASVKSILWAGLGGMWTSVKGYRKLDLGAEYGKATLKGKSAVDVTSEDGEAKISAKTVAQVVADDTAFLHGKSKLVATSGEGSGTGVICAPSRIFFGSVSNAKDSAASAKSDSGITLDDQCLVITKEQAGIKLQSSELMVAAPSIVIQAKSSNVNIEGSRILIG